MIKDQITFFRGYHFFLSNFFPIRLRAFGLVVPTSEHAYQMCRCTEDIYRKMIAVCKTPGEAKKLVRKLPCRPDWDRVKVNYMRLVLEAKFRNGTLSLLLKETSPAELIEGNSWGDDFWGCVRSGREDWKGQNQLGKLLMDIRSRL